jgi:hypothetical protein
VEKAELPCAGGKSGFDVDGPSDHGAPGSLFTGAEDDSQGPLLRQVKMLK